ncbi:GOLPH3/VPS74 family protein [Streptomyces sp. NRRL WC-3742]|uniref:GOLPH3/VPS74 family protein n=1 Tax=Streptomyces sp. NRRL WC-3742 TaxID=1463934 RepID=UPI0004C7EABC|nr:GPP34 family phosphoprotein [Streptomyces sp. NRRL WC-3742]
MDTQVTLAEEVLLLTLDDESGVAKERAGAAWAIPGALLAELALAGRVVLEDGKVSAVGREPVGEPLLDGCLGRLVAWAEGRRTAKASDWLLKDRATAPSDTLARLVERGLVTEERHKALGIFPVRRYPEADGSVERALRERLAAVVLHGAEPDARTGALIALLHASDLHRSAFPDVPRKAVAPRFAEIAEGEWADRSVREAIRNARAVLAAVIAVTAATTATTAATM